jgi:protein SCO1/2
MARRIVPPHTVESRPWPGRRKVQLAWLLLACVTGFFTACQSSPRRYTLRGEVVEKNLNTNQLTLRHEEIPGVMPAMTMPYTVRNPDQLLKIEKGDEIAADLRVPQSGAPWIENIVVTRKSEGRVATSSSETHFVQIGETPPDVPFVNQDGKTLHFSQFKGKAVLFTFIYTRCADPDFCPLLSSDFAEMHRELAKSAAELERTHFLSVTLDPAYDTPSVLRKYGLIYLHDDPSGFSHWDFVAANADHLKNLAGAFGLEYSRNGNQITHSMNTVLLAPDGTVAAMWPDQFLKHAEILGAMRKALPATN